MKKLNTLADALALIAAMKESKDEGIRRHAATLEGPRTRGSTTEYGLETFKEPLRSALPLTPLLNHPAVTAGCDAYTFDDNGLLCGQLGAVTLREALTHGHCVKVREGAHGPELFIDRPVDEAGRTATCLFTIIVGEEAGETVLFTWHPGMPLKPLCVGELYPDTAVKLHNG